MALFENLGRENRQNAAPAAPMNYGQQIDAIRANPGQYIHQAGVQIPETMYNDPRAMVQHLLQTNQVPMGRRSIVMPMINRLMGRK